MGKRRLERVRSRRAETEDEAAAEAEEDEEGSGDVLEGINNLRIETAGTEEEATEGMAEALRMEGVEDEGSEGEEGGGGTQRALEALEFLTQDVEPSGTTLVDARNGFNECSAAWLCILSEELKGFQCLLSPSTPFLSLDFLVLHTLHPQRLCHPLGRFLLCACRLYS